MKRRFFKRIFAFALLLGGLAFLYWNYFVCQTQFSGEIPKDNKTLIIFDFDGTVADSWKHVVRIMNRIAPEYGFNHISHENQENFRNMELKQILKEIEVGTLKLPFVVKRVRKEMQKNIESIDIVPGVKLLFDQLKKKNYSIGIVTSNSIENTKKFLKRHNITNVDFIYSSICLHGKDKLIKDIMAQASIDGEKVYFVGDEVRDIEAAHKAKTQSIAVTWGFSNESLLLQSNPGYITKKPSEILDIFV